MPHFYATNARQERSSDVNYYRDYLYNRLSDSCHCRNWIVQTRLSASVLAAPCLWFADPGVTMLCCCLICIAFTKRSPGAPASIADAAAPCVDRPSMLVLTISILAAAAARLARTDLATRRSSPSNPVANPWNTHL